MKMCFLYNKKGITSTIAVVLLLIMTVSAAGTAFYWLNLIEGQLKAEEQLNVKEFAPLEGEIKVVAARYNEQLDNLVMFVENIGTATIPIKTVSTIPTTLWVLKDGQQEMICSTDWSGVENGPVCKEGCIGAVASGELRRVVLANLGPNALCNVANQPSNSLIHYTIDFSGKAVAAGGFVR